MTRVNFYLMEQEDEASRRRFACRLAEKLQRQGMPLQIYAGSKEEAGELDRLLWSFNTESFVPHALADSPIAEAVTVLLAWGNPASPDTLLNLSDDVPPGLERFSTIAEFIGSDASARARGRELWNRYKAAGCELQHHQV
jgi:DNA polymerase III subunit chi